MPLFSLLLSYQPMKYIILYSPPQIFNIWRWRQSNAQSHVAGGEADRSGELRRVRGRSEPFEICPSLISHPHFSLSPFNLFLDGRMKNCVSTRSYRHMLFLKREVLCLSPYLFLSPISVLSQWNECHRKGDVLVRNVLKHDLKLGLSENKFIGERKQYKPT